MKALLKATAGEVRFPHQHLSHQDKASPTETASLHWELVQRVGGALCGPAKGRSGKWSRISKSASQGAGCAGSQEIRLRNNTALGPSWVFPFLLLPSLGLRLGQEFLDLGSRSPKWGFRVPLPSIKGSATRSFQGVPCSLWENNSSQQARFSSTQMSPAHHSSSVRLLSLGF